MRRVVVLFASAALSVTLGSVSPSLVTATQQESGTISCSSSARHSFLTVRYSDWVGAWRRVSRPPTTTATTTA
jgi:hypothetical protein